MKKEALLCASFRADNLQNRINDFLADHKSRRTASQKKCFHKLNLRSDELSELFKQLGFVVEKVTPVENMPLFYKFKFFRFKTHRNFNESLGRKEGYKLNLIGKFLQGFLFKLFPHEFCNLYVLFARKSKS
jgi:hypothetical protein